jgi:hypothetical protein
LGEPQVANSFFDEGVAGDQLEALHLPEVGLLARHIDEEELGDIPGSHEFFVFLGKAIGTTKDSLMTAIYFWYSARSSARVLVFRMQVMN